MNPTSLNYTVDSSIDYQSLALGTQLQILLNPAAQSSTRVIIETHPSVWAPTPFAIRLAELIARDDCQDKVVLDFAAGSGILAIVAAKQGAKRVIATDLNPDAIAVAQRNWRLNGLPENSFEPIQSDCFTAMRDRPSIQGQLDRIYANPPTIPETGKPKTLAGAWNQNGAQGRLVTDALIQEGRTFLKPGGEMLFIATSKQGSCLTWKQLQHYWGSGPRASGDDPLDYVLDWTQRGTANWAVVDRLDLPLADYYLEFLPEIRRQAAQQGETDPFVQKNGKIHQKLYFIRTTHG